MTPVEFVAARLAAREAKALAVKAAARHSARYVQILARSHSDHPDYDERWRP